MSTQETNIDLGSTPGDDFDPFASNAELEAETSSKASTPYQKTPETPPATTTPMDEAISKAEDKMAEKHICVVPARDGHVYEIRCTGAGRFIARTDNVKELSEINAGYTPAFPPLPFEQFSQIIAFFRHYMRCGRESEVMVYLYWDREEQRYRQANLRNCCF